MDGTVLIAGGFRRFAAMDSAELFDPVSNTMSVLSATMTVGRSDATAVLLLDGKVLIVGGAAAPQANDERLQATAELFDPASRTFRATAGTMAIPRATVALILLTVGPDRGKVLVAGGQDMTGATPFVELYDPTTEQFSTQTYAMTSPRAGCSVTILSNNQVLFAGGRNGGPPFGTAELYDPIATKFVATGTMAVRRTSHASTLLPNGRVLISGGVDERLDTTSSAELFDPDHGTFARTSSLAAARAYHGSVLLPTGQALIVGGVGAVPLANGEIYFAATAMFVRTPSALSLPRGLPSVTLLQDGRVLIAGGQAMNGQITTSVDLYAP
jgi:hypothetical protein